MRCSQTVPTIESARLWLATALEQDGQMDRLRCHLSRRTTPRQGNYRRRPSATRPGIHSRSGSLSAPRPTTLRRATQTRDLAKAVAMRSRPNNPTHVRLDLALPAKLSAVPSSRGV